MHNCNAFQNCLLRKVEGNCKLKHYQTAHQTLLTASIIVLGYRKAMYYYYGIDRAVCGRMWTITLIMIAELQLQYFDYMLHLEKAKLTT